MSTLSELQKKRDEEEKKNSSSASRAQTTRGAATTLSELQRQRDEQTGYQAPVSLPTLEDVTPAMKNPLALGGPNRAYQEARAARQTPTVTPANAAESTSGRNLQQRREESRGTAEAFANSTLGRMGTAIASDFGSAAANLGGTLLHLGNRLNYQAGSDRAIIENAQKNLQTYTQRRDAATTAEDRAYWQKLMDAAQAQINAHTELAEFKGRDTLQGAQSLYETSDRLNQQAQQAATAAKEGKSAIEQKAIDAGILLGGIGADVGMNALLPGAGTLARTVNIAGNATRDYRQNAGEEYDPTKAALRGTLSAAGVLLGQAFSREIGTAGAEILRSQGMLGEILPRVGVGAASGLGFAMGEVPLTEIGAALTDSNYSLEDREIGKRVASAVAFGALDQFFRGLTQKYFRADEYTVAEPQRKMKWFSEDMSLEDAAKLRRSLSRQYHPDLGGDQAIMQEINDEYSYFLQNFAGRAAKAYADAANAKAAGDAAAYEAASTQYREAVGYLQEAVKDGAITGEPANAVGVLATVASDGIPSAEITPATGRVEGLSLPQLEGTQKNTAPVVSAVEGAASPVQDAGQSFRPMPGKSEQSLGQTATQEVKPSVAEGTAKGKDDLEFLVKNNGRDYEKKFGPQAAEQKFYDAIMAGDVKENAGGDLYVTKPEDHIDNRDMASVSPRSVKSFQYLNPEVHPYYAEVAQVLMNELRDTQKPEMIRIPEGMGENGVWQQESYFRTSRHTTPAIAELRDDYNISYADIEKALQAIIDDKGADNIAVAKRVELLIDEMLENDYFVESEHQNLSGFIDVEAYKRAKDAIRGAQEREEYAGGDMLADIDALPDGLSLPALEPEANVSTIGGAAGNVSTIRQMPKGITMTAGQEPAEIQNGGLTNEREQTAGTEPAAGAKQQSAGSLPLPDGDAGRRGAERFGERAGRVSQDVRNAGGTKRNREIAQQRQLAVENQPLTSPADIGFPDGSEEATCKLYPEADWDDETRSAVEWARTKGVEVVPVVGLLQNSAGDSVVGAIDKVTGRVWVRADSASRSLSETVEHEVGHRQTTESTVRAFMERIQQNYKESAWKMVYEAYKAKYAGLTSNYAGMTEDQIDLYVWEEILEDAYSDTNRFGTKAGVYSEDAYEIIEAGGEPAGLSLPTLDGEAPAGEATGAAGNRGPPGRYSYGGRNANKADLDALAEAERLEMQNIDAEDIRRSTGWFRGADGKWRFEIDDSGMTYRRGGDAYFRSAHPEYVEYWDLLNRMLSGELLPEADEARLKELDSIWAHEYGRLSKNVDRGNATLADIIDHPELFRNYPQLRFTRVRFEELPRGTRGQYDTERNAITLDNSLRSAPENTLVHEIQHAIQAAEGFAGGSSVDSWRSKLAADQRRNIEEADAKVREIFESMPDDVKNKVRAINRANADQDWDTAIRLENELYDEGYGDLFAAYEDAHFDRLTARERQKNADLDEEAYNLYRNTAGEIEARDVTARRTMTPEQRRATRPDTGEGRAVFAEDLDHGLSYDTEQYTDEEKRQHAKEVVSYFGKTYNWNETGYLTQDGTRVDFSGKHDGGPGGYRTVDHREITDALGVDYGGDDYSGAMVQFMSEGNIRIMPETNGINLQIEPTPEQYDQLERFIQRAHGEVMLDIDDARGNTVESVEYDEGTRASKVLSDIKTYFKTGTMPGQSEVAQFHNRFSVDDEPQGLSLPEPEEEGQDKPAAYSGAAILQESTIDKYLKDYAAPGTPKYAQAYIAWMEPQDFINLTTSRGGREIIEQTKKPLNAGEFAKATQQNPLQLNINHETGEITGHEGRHRAAALRDAGVEKIPVLLFDSSNKYDKAPIDILKLHGQDFGSNRSYADLYVHDLLPLSYENRDAIIKRFGTQRAIDRFNEKYNGTQSLRYSVEDGNLYRPEGMSDEEYNALNESWRAGAERRRPRIETFDNVDDYARDVQRRAEERRAERMAKNDKASFTGTPALQKLGVKVDGSVGNYANIDQLRAFDKSAKQLRSATKRAERRLGATAKEKSFASGIVAGVYGEGDIPKTMDADKVLELADYYTAEGVAKNDLIRNRRAEINRTLDEKMEALFKDSDKFKPGKMLTLNYRTPRRNILSIFGDERGREIVDYLIDPIQTNEAENIRFKNRMFDEARKFTDSKGKQSKLTERESAVTQMVMEGKVAAETVAGMQMREAIESTARNLKDGKGMSEAMSQYVLNANEQKLAEQYARWLEAEEAMESGKVDSVKVNNAAEKLGKMYGDFYDAINDFLIAHGYEPIGFVRGYAPHMQPEETVDLFTKALDSLGVGGADVATLPASIAGLTASYKPNMRWNPHFQHRVGDTTKYDAMEGFENYVEYMGDILYHTDDVMKLRRASSYFRTTYAPEEIKENISWAKELRYGTTEEKENLLRDNGQIDRSSVMTDRDIDAKLDEYVEKLIGDVKVSEKYSNFVMWLDNYANILAGKQSMADRGQEYQYGRKVLNIGNKLNRTFSNAKVAGNMSSVLNQTAQLPQIVAENGAWRSGKAFLQDVFGGEKFRSWAQDSDFLTEKKGLDYLVMDKGEKILNGMFAPASFMDGLLSTVAVRGRYLKEIKSGKSHAEAMKIADEYGRSVMGSRAKGSAPLAFHAKNPVARMVNVFQIEALNSWEHLAQDLPRDVREVEKEHGKAKASMYLAGIIVKMLLGAFVLNRAAEEIYGGTPAPFDILGLSANFIASGEGLTTNEYLKTVIDNGLEALGGERLFDTDKGKIGDEPFDWATAADDLGYNVMNDVPFVRNVAGILGLGDQTVPLPNVGKGAEDIKSAVKDDGLISADAGKALLGLAAELAPGGAQLKKTVTAIDYLNRGGDFSGSGDKERLKYPADTDFASVVQAMMFGKYATQASDEFYASGRSALSAKQTQLWRSLKESGVDGKEAYEAIQQYREAEDDEEKRSAVVNGLDWTDAQKMQLWNGLRNASADWDDSKAKAAGVSTEVYIRFQTETKGFTSDKDGNGKTISGSKKQKVVNYINGLPISAAQKDALYYDAGYAESKIDETPWHELKGVSLPGLEG